MLDNELYAICMSCSVHAQHTSAHIIQQRLYFNSLMFVQITWEDLAAAEQAVGTFGGDNRAGVQGTLHRISAIRNRKGTVVGLTCRVGRAVTGHIDMIRDMLEGLSLVSFCHNLFLCIAACTCL